MAEDCFIVYNAANLFDGILFSAKQVGHNAQRK